MTAPHHHRRSVTIDPTKFRQTVGAFPSGIVIVGTTDGDLPTGFTCQSFYSVSLNPPLVSFSVSLTSRTLPQIRNSDRFSVSMLTEHHRHAVDLFSQRNVDRWAGVNWHLTGGGNPVLSDALAWVDCTVQETHPAGDHVIVVGRVVELHRSGNQRPLVYCRSDYHSLSKL